MPTQEEIAQQLVEADAQYNAHQQHTVFDSHCMWCKEEADYLNRSALDDEDGGLHEDQTSYLGHMVGPVR